VESGLLVNSIKNGGLGAFIGEKRGAQIELEAPRDLVIEFDLCAKLIAGCPDLGQGQAILDIEVLGLNVASNVSVLGVAEASDLECDVAWGLGLDFKIYASNGEILAQQIIRAFAQILPGWGNWLGKRHS